jgi:MarR family transcriptional regulator, multiple antibiotic resistance protein MarR
MARRTESIASRAPRPSALGAANALAPAFVLEQHLFFWVTQVLDRRDRQLAAALRPDGLRAPEWRILATLHSRHRLSMSELADLTSIDRTTLSRVVERMVRAGWLMRLSDTSDARVTRLALTASGERLFARIWPAVWQVNERAVARLPEPAVGLVRWALQEMCRNFDASNLAGKELA